VLLGDATIRLKVTFVTNLVLIKPSRKSHCGTAVTATLVILMRLLLFKLASGSVMNPLYHDGPEKGYYFYCPEVN